MFGFGFGDVVCNVLENLGDSQCLVDGLFDTKLDRLVAAGKHKLGQNGCSMTAKVPLAATRRGMTTKEMRTWIGRPAHVKLPARHDQFGSVVLNNALHRNKGVVSRARMYFRFSAVPSPLQSETHGARAIYTWTGTPR